MKKLFLLLAACGLMVACGGEQKKEDKAAADQNKQEQNDGKSTVDPENAPEVKAPATALEFVKASVEAAKAGDVVKYVELWYAYEKFAEGLEKDELEKQNEELEAWMKDEKNKEAVEAVAKFATAKNQEIAAEYQKLVDAEWEKSTKDPENVEKPAANLTISQMFDQMYDAIQNDDMARFIELVKVVDSWGDELTPAQEEELEAYAMQNYEKMMVVMEAVAMIDLDEYEGDCDCCVDCEEPMLYEVEDYYEDYEDYEDEWSDEEEW